MVEVGVWGVWGSWESWAIESCLRNYVLVVIMRWPARKRVAGTYYTVTTVNQRNYLGNILQLIPSV